MTQSDLRIESICAEFDARLEQVGVVIARLELAKALAENEETVVELSELKMDYAIKGGEMLAEIARLQAQHDGWKKVAEKAYHRVMELNAQVESARVAMQFRDDDGDLWCPRCGGHFAVHAIGCKIGEWLLSVNQKDGETPEETINPYLLTGDELKRTEDKVKRGEK
jgi:hypothetical protein